MLNIASGSLYKNLCFFVKHRIILIWRTHLCGHWGLLLESVKKFQVIFKALSYAAKTNTLELPLMFFMD